MTVTYFTPPGEGEQRRGLMPLGLFLFSIFLVVTCPRPPVFARPNILVASFATQAVVASFAAQARACILSDHNIFYTPRGGGNGGVMPLGLFLFLVKTYLKTSCLYLLYPCIAAMPACQLTWQTCCLI